MLLKLVILSVVASCAYAAQPDWNDLKVTWGINPFSSYVFASLPRTEDDAIKSGWKLEKDCSKVVGSRYVFGDDRSVLLIFGANGDLAGIATVIPKGLPHNFPSKKVSEFLNDEGDVYTLSAYFVDPSTVCSNKQKSVSLGGDRLVIKSAQQQLNIPLTETEVQQQGFWTNGKCFYTMGQHYWANANGVPLAVDVRSDDFFPMFLLYNKGKLNGFGWAFNADLKSNRYEHPEPSVVSKFMNPVPDFFLDPKQVGTLSTMHIYLDSTPRFNFC